MNFFRKLLILLAASVILPGAGCKIIVEKENKKHEVQVKPDNPLNDDDEDYDD